MLDPKQDAKRIVKEFSDFKYGAAAPMMMAYIEELEALREKAVTEKWHRALWTDDTWEKMYFVKPEQIVRWSKDFDKMQELVKNDPIRARNVRIARLGVDVWMTCFLPRIKNEYPDMEVNIEKLMADALLACAEAEKAGMVSKRRNMARRVFEEMALYAYLKDKTIPSELSHYPKGKIIRHLPPRSMGANQIVKDADAVTGFAIKAEVPEGKHFDKGVPYEYYDAMNKKWVFRGTIPLKDIAPGKYKLYKLGVGNLGNRCNLVPAGLWSGINYDLGRHFDPSYQQRQYEFWVSLKFDGPKFDPKSNVKGNYISSDQVFLVDKGMPQ
jgi:hypothetical protein